MRLLILLWLLGNWSEAAGLGQGWRLLAGELCLQLLHPLGQHSDVLLLQHMKVFSLSPGNRNVLEDADSLPDYQQLS